MFCDENCKAPLLLCCHISAKSFNFIPSVIYYTMTLSLYLNIGKHFYVQVDVDFSCTY